MHKYFAEIECLAVQIRSASGTVNQVQYHFSYNNLIQQNFIENYVHIPGDQEQGVFIFSFFPFCFRVHVVFLLSLSCFTPTLALVMNFQISKTDFILVQLDKFKVIRN